MYLPVTQAYTDPKRSVFLLDELRAHGFTNSAFTRLHHFPTPQTVATHRSYCLKISAFLSGSTNALVQKRLELVLRAYWGGSFRSRAPELWLGLAEAALAEVPHGAAA